MKYYVYTHHDPVTHELMYIGKGSGGRAWDVSRNRSENPLHQKWMLCLLENGYLPIDWTDIESKNLTNEEARKRELQLIHTNPSRFNRQSGENQHQSKLTNNQAIEIYKRIHTGEKARALSEEFKVSRAAIYHIKNKNQWKAVLAGVSI